MLKSQTAKQWFYFFTDITTLFSLLLLATWVINRDVPVKALIAAIVLGALSACLHLLHTKLRLEDIVDGRLLADNRMVVYKGNDRCFFNMDDKLPGSLHQLMLGMAGIYAVLLTLEPLGFWHMVAVTGLGVIISFLYRVGQSDLFEKHIYWRKDEITEGTRLRTGHVLHKLPDGDYIKTASLNSKEETLCPDTRELRAFLLKFAANAIGQRSLSAVKVPPYTANRSTASPRKAAPSKKSDAA